MAGGKSTMTGQHSLMTIVDLGQKRTEIEKKKKIEEKQQMSLF